MKHTLLKFAAIAMMMTSLTAISSNMAYANDKGMVMTNAFIKAMSPDQNTILAAADSPSKGVIGGEVANDVIVEPLVLEAPPAPAQAPSTVPPVFSPMVAPANPVGHDPGTGVAATAPAAPDPCAAFTADYSSYTVCQDRIMKYQRMKDSKTKRVESQAATDKKALDDKAARQEAAAAAMAAKDQKKTVVSGPSEAELAATAAAIAAAVAAATNKAGAPAAGTVPATTPATAK